MLSVESLLSYQQPQQNPVAHLLASLEHQQRQLGLVASPTVPAAAAHQSPSTNSLLCSALQSNPQAAAIIAIAQHQHLRSAGNNGASSQAASPIREALPAAAAASAIASGAAAYTAAHGCTAVDTAAGAAISATLAAIAAAAQAADLADRYQRGMGAYGRGAGAMLVGLFSRLIGVNSCCCSGDLTHPCEHMQQATTAADEAAGQEEQEEEQEQEGPAAEGGAEAAAATHDRDSIPCTQEGKAATGGASTDAPTGTAATTSNAAPAGGRVVAVAQLAGSKRPARDVNQDDEEEDGRPVEGGCRPAKVPALGHVTPERPLPLHQAAA